MNLESGPQTEINNKLKYHRCLQNLSQEELAATSGVSIRTIQRIEKGVSTGGAYTLNALAQTLQVTPADLTTHNTITLSSYSNTQSGLKLLNLSALVVILLPLSNIILPAIILFKNKNDETTNYYGRKIVSFQILWTLCTLFTMIIVPLVLLVFQSFRGNSIPLFIPVYFVLVMVNICFIIRFALCLANQPTFLKNLPNII